MPEQPTPEQVREWAECADKATPNWRYTEPFPDWLNEQPSWLIADFQFGVSIQTDSSQADSPEQAVRDAQFAVAARTAVPALCVAVERLRTELLITQRWASFWADEFEKRGGDVAATHAALSAQAKGG